ncbi:DNA translocase FtsK [Priestia flexa]|uniref:DNA translocase FtsK n=1 Tax=Priestia flexa TaxID=86664 RepID=UPI00288FCD4B|nr:DNA translocase FtsK [Priestia flexa]MDT2045161.1 DNA translocase FtsK [Priestia flexa]
MGFMRKMMDYLLGYEVKEIIVDEEGRQTEIPLNEPKKETEMKQRPVQETVNEKAATPKKQTPARLPRQEKGTTHQDLEAKVAYHYPKGQFRFPLIDDNQFSRSDDSLSHEVRRRERPAEEVKNEREFVRKSRQMNREEPAPFQRPEYVKPVQEKKVSVASKPTSQVKKPFRPTEIPSPVYGFNKRPANHQLSQQHSEVVEFELSSSAGIKPTPTYESLRKEIRNERTYVEPLVRKEQQEESKEVENVDSFNEQVKDVYVEPQTVPSLHIEERPLEEVEKPSIQFEGHGTIESIAPEVVEKSESIEEDVPQQEAPIVDEFEEVKESQPAIEEEPQAYADEPEDTNRKPEKSSASSSNGGRRLVPFNVMMLKKDREKVAQSSSVERLKTQEKQEECEEEPTPILLKEATPLADSQAELSYQFPSMSMLNAPLIEMEEDHDWVQEQSDLLDMTLNNFNVRAKVVNVTQGPTVTRFEVQPEPGVKVNKITNLTDDIKLSLAARDIRIEAPIPGKNTIGIEVPNQQSKPVLLSEIVNDPAFTQNKSPLTVALGLDISGAPVVTDLNKMPHGLIAGATGSGKSVCINTIIVSLLYKAAPHEVKLMLIDPKMVELAPYNGIPHLVSPVITDAKAATTALKWAVEEMERRYELFAHTGVRDITRYNEKVEEHSEKSSKLPYLVIIIDELADLMMVSPGEVEEAICRIAQKARACGIHLLLATQRPSVDVITGLIKANVPTRVAFSVSSQVDSRTIIDTGGAEKLLGKGDMLLLENGSSKTVRVQGNFVSDEEIDRVVDHVKSQMKPTYLFDQQELLKKQQTFSTQEDDELFYEACEFALNQDGASASSLQRRFRIGYNRAARLIDMMEQQGIISEAKGSKPRDVLITEDELHELENKTASY